MEPGKIEGRSRQGKNILIRGAGYSFDLLLRSSPERQQAELNYVRDLNLNAVRLDGHCQRWL